MAIYRLAAPLMHGFSKTSKENERVGPMLISDLRLPAHDTFDTLAFLPSSFF